MENNSRLSVNVDVTGFEVFQELIAVMRSIVDDERIPLEIREEYMDKISDVIKGNKPECNHEILLGSRIAKCSSCGETFNTLLPRGK